MATSTTTTLMSTTLVGVPLEKTCPTCGQAPDYPHPAELTRRRVRDLEGQVQYLNSQAAQMSDKLAEYEEEVRRLRAQNNNQPALSTFSQRNGTSISSTSTGISGGENLHLHSHSQSPPQQQGRLSSLSSLLPYRRPSTASSQTKSQPQPQTQQSPPPLQLQAQTQSPPAPPRTPTPRASSEEALELQNALNREQNLRKAAETQLTQASSELEELTTQLFSQANEMVAQERKARARLEERVAVLERRDLEKRSRLERLERAMDRVERIRALVG
ncbi:hypothetical protein BDW62DRAFT_194491 [Aspergillus aurantiobrunneus]